MGKRKLFWTLTLAVCLWLTFALTSLADHKPGHSKGGEDGKGGGGGAKGGDLALIAEFREAYPGFNDEFGSDGPSLVYVHGEGAEAVIVGKGNDKGNLSLLVGGNEGGGDRYRDFFISFDEEDCVVPGDGGACAPPFWGPHIIGVDDLWARLRTRGADLLKMREEGQETGQPVRRAHDVQVGFQYPASTWWYVRWGNPTGDCPDGTYKQADIVYDPATDSWVISADDATNPMACLVGGDEPFYGSFAMSFRVVLTPKP